MKIKFNKKGNIVLSARYQVKYDRFVFTFPKGFQSDGASIPLVFQSFFKPFEGDTLDAALVHDALYSTKGHYKLGKDTLKTSRKFADRLLRKIMRSRHVPAWKCWMYWVAVRIGGIYPWMFSPRRKKLISVIIKM